MRTIPSRFFNTHVVDGRDGQAWDTMMKASTMFQLSGTGRWTGCIPSDEWDVFPTIAGADAKKCEALDLKGPVVNGRGDYDF